MSPILCILLLALGRPLRSCGSLADSAVKLRISEGLDVVVDPVDLSDGRLAVAGIIY